MKRILVLILLIYISISSFAFKTQLIEVDFTNNKVYYKDKIYELVECTSKQKRYHREVTYRCIDDSNCNAIIFRIYADDKKLIKLQFYKSKK